MTEKAAKDLLADIAAASMPDAQVLERSLALSGEPAITAFLKWVLMNGAWGALMRPVFVSDEDTVVFNYQLRVGTADIVAFHIDGTATVIELKDGSQGFRSVIGGLGQAGLYAAQIDPSMALKGVRRALAWTPVASPEGVNQLISMACKEAGAIPVLLPRLEGMVKVVMHQHLQGVLEALRPVVMRSHE